MTSTFDATTSDTMVLLLDWLADANQAAEEDELIRALIEEEAGARPAGSDAEFVAWSC